MHLLNSAKILHCFIPTVRAELYPFDLWLGCGEAGKVDLYHCIWSSHANQHIRIEFDGACYG